MFPQRARPTPAGPLRQLRDRIEANRVLAERMLRDLDRTNA